MYSSSFKATCNSRLYLDFETGGIQGMGTTSIFFNAGKWAIEKETIQDLKSMTNDDFGITGKIDYHDDGLTMFDWKFLRLYINTIVKKYKKSFTRI